MQRSDRANITEIFNSYQGEGTLAGQRHIFVRFSGCNLACTYCDTPGVFLRGKTMSVSEVLKKINKIASGADTVSFTGGEPLLYAGFIKKVAPALKKSGYMIYLETNGTLVDEMKSVAGLIDVVAMDFKLPSDCGAVLWEKHKEFIESAGNNVLVKMVITEHTRDEDILRAIKIIQAVEKKNKIKIPFVLQPVTPKGVKPAGQKMIERWLDMSRKKLGRAYLIPQMQRFWGVR